MLQLVHQINSFHVQGESCEVRSKSSVKRPVGAGDGGDGEGNCPTVQSQHFQPHCRIKEVSTNQIKSPLCSHQAVRFQYIKHILEELYPVYSVHPLLLYSVKTTTNRASITYISPPLSSCGIFPSQKIFLLMIISVEQDLELANLN